MPWRLDPPTTIAMTSESFLSESPSAATLKYYINFEERGAGLRFGSPIAFLSAIGASSISSPPGSRVCPASKTWGPKSDSNVAFADGHLTEELRSELTTWWTTRVGNLKLVKVPLHTPEVSRCFQREQRSQGLGTAR